jgi:hypothetical protein
MRPFWLGFAYMLRVLVMKSRSGNARGRAARHGRLAVLATLLTARSDVNTRTTNGTSMLMLAAYGGHVEACELLLRHGAELRARNAWDCDVGHFAAMGGWDAIDLMRMMMVMVMVVVVVTVTMMMMMVMMMMMMMMMMMTACALVEWWAAVSACLPARPPPPAAPPYETESSGCAY